MAVGVGPGSQYSPGLTEGLPTHLGTSRPAVATPKQAGQAMVQAGFPKDPKVIAEGIGVMTAESGRRRNAHNPSGADGYWQILGDHPACGSCSGGRAMTRDLLRSTRCAHCIWEHAGKTFAKDWTAWSPGIGEPFMKDAQAAIADSSGALFDLPSIPNPLEGLDAIAAVLEAIAKFFVGLGELLLTPEGWIRLGKLIAGAALVGVGINRLTRETIGVDPLGSARRAAGIAAAAGGPAVRTIGAAAS